MVGLFKALADPTRLRLLGLMVDRERCGQELASILGVSPATISHHMKLLREAGLLRESRQRPFRFYRLDLKALQQALSSLANRKKIESLASDGDLSQAERKVLHTFFDGPRLVSIPAQRRKKEIVFEEVLRRIPRRKQYEERELSRFIETMHQDYATIRREFIMGRYMERENGQYWLTEKGREVVARSRTARAGR